MMVCNYETINGYQLKGETLKMMHMMNKRGGVWMLLLLVVTVAATLAWSPQAKVNAQDAAEGDNPLLRPDSPLMNADPPAWFKVRFETSKGNFVVLVQRKWAPKGAGRFYNLVRHGFYDDARFFRVIQGFMAQFGINGDPRVSRMWQNEMIKDDPVMESNTRRRITFAKSSRPNSRTTQVFINTRDNERLDRDGFAPFGEVVEGMNIVDMLHDDYGEGAPRGRGPDQQRIQEEGNTYLKAQFPNLDYIIKATIIEEG